MRPLAVLAAIGGAILAAHLFRRRPAKTSPPLTSPEDRRVLMPGQHQVKAGEVVRLGTRLGTPWPAEANDTVVTAEYWNLAGEAAEPDGKVLTTLMPAKLEVEARVSVPGTAKIRASFPDGTRIGEWALVTDAPLSLGSSV